MCGFGVLSLPSDRCWHQLPLGKAGEKRYSREDEHCAHELHDVQERCHLQRLKNVLEVTALVHIPAELRQVLFGFQYFRVFLSLWVFSV